MRASGEAPHLFSRAYFVASGLGFGQEKYYRRLWYRVTHTYPFSFPIITKDTGITSGIEPCVLCLIFLSY